MILIMSLMLTSGSVPVSLAWSSTTGPRKTASQSLWSKSNFLLFLLSCNNHVFCPRHSESYVGPPCLHMQHFYHEIKNVFSFKCFVPFLSILHHNFETQNGNALFFFYHLKKN